MMAAGAGPLLGYLQNRSMSLGVFLPSTADAEMIDEREMVDSIVGQAKLYGVNFDSVTGLDTEDFAAGKEGDEELAAAQKALQQKKDDAERARPRAPPQGLWSAFVGGLMSVGLPPPKPHSVTNKLVETDEIRRNKSLIQNAVKKSNLTYEQTLVLADEDAVLAAARDVGCVTCRLNAPNRRRGRVTTDLAAQGMDGLKGLIEEYNGVSFR
mmetsp:Transcript_5996/g.23288  ORF Transcript_5996/g.23288 Transcript_5996/m.23288 type:complete len:211 (-) Transcript_5996:64-696(-)